MAKQKTVTGVRSAFVKVGDHEVTVHHGEPLPDGVSTEEIKRLDGLGVFGPTPRHLLPVDQRPPLRAKPGTSELVEDTSRAAAEAEARAAAAEQTAEQLQTQLDEANAKLVQAARLGPVLAGDIDAVKAHVAEHPEDLQALVWLESQREDVRKGITDLAKA